MNVVRPHNELIKLFPSPHFLRMPAVGIDISDTSIKFLELNRHHGAIALGRFGEHAIPAGAIAQGEIRDPKPIVAVLTQLREREQLRFVRVSLPEERAFVFETKIPIESDPEHARQLIEFRLAENVPITPTEAVFDYEVIGIASGRQVEVGVSVFARSTVDQYLSLCTEAGLFPLSFEIEAQALARAVIPEGDQGSYLLVDFGRMRTGVGIVSRGALVFTATLDIGGNNLTQAIEQQFGVTAQEAERIKNEVGIMRGSHNGKAYEAIVSTIAALHKELAQYMGYWQSHASAARNEPISVEKVILCGGNANIRGLPEYFTEALKIPAERANVWTNTFSLDEVIPALNRHHSYGYATAVGLALRGL